MSINIFSSIEILKNNIILKKQDEKVRVAHILNKEMKKISNAEKWFLLQLKIREKLINIDNSWEYKLLEEHKHNKELISNPEIYEDVEGIRFISNNEEGLNKLIDYYMISKKKAQSDGTQILLDNLGDHNCIITDLKTSFSDTSCTKYLDRKTPPFVYFCKSDIQRMNENIFYHEIGHFYDMSRNVLKIDNIIKNIHFDKEKANKFLHSINANLYDIYNMTMDEVRNSDSLMEMILQKHHAFNQEFLNNFTISAINSTIRSIAADVVDEVYKRDGFDAMSDIVEAVSVVKRIKLEEYIQYGHGKRYYKNKITPSAEVFANFANLYTTGKEKILDEVFPEEFRRQLKDVYMDTILDTRNISNTTKSITNK